MADKASIEALSNAIYASCATSAENTVFFQNDLLSFDIIPKRDLATLLACTQNLTKKGLFKVMKKDERLCWRIVKKEDASKYKHFSVEEALVFSYIESAAREGIWTRSLRIKTNLHLSTLNACLRTLESKSAIKTVTSAKFPTRKTYMLSHLQPSEDVTGGAFYTDGKLDELFIAELQKFAEAVIRKRSWVIATNQVAHDADDDDDDDGPGHASEGGGKKRAPRIVPPPAEYRGYPSLQEITKAFNESKVSNISIREAEMKQVLDLLVWDGRVTRVLKGRAFKAVFPEAGLRDMENGLTQAPCGRCVVFDLCEEGGPVNAASCAYFQDWLAGGGG